MLDIRKDREYSLIIENKQDHWVVTGIERDDKTKCLKAVTATNVRSGATNTFTRDEFMRAKQCVNNCDLFIMFCNWQNFFRPGPHQDLEYARRLRLTILKTLAENGWVIKGAGKLEAPDFRIVEKIQSNHP